MYIWFYQKFNNFCVDNFLKSIWSEFWDKFTTLDDRTISTSIQLLAVLGGFVKCYLMLLYIPIQNWNFIQFNQYLMILSFKVRSICSQYFAEQLASVDRCDVYTNVHLWLILRLPNDQEKSFTFGFKLKKTIFVCSLFFGKHSNSLLH